MYLAGNRVFRVRDRGESFEAISPDLTTSHPERTTATGSGAENYGVVYALAESPIAAGHALGRDRRRQAVAHARRRREVDRPDREPPGRR